MKDTVYERYRGAKYRSRDSETGSLVIARPVFRCCLYCLLVKQTLNLIQRSSSLTKTYKLLFEMNI
jgi:hypothetical protein